jgi:hypothetical protein
MTTISSTTPPSWPSWATSSTAPRRRKPGNYAALDSRRRGCERKFLYQIISNSLNSIDVDKCGCRTRDSLLTLSALYSCRFDYLARDCYNLGIKSSYDSSRLMSFSRVIEDEICFHSKEAYNLYEMFHTRYTLHKQVYGHRVSKAVEYMVQDVLALADPYLRISDKLHEAAEYMSLSDSVLHLVEISKVQFPPPPSPRPC